MLTFPLCALRPKPSSRGDIAGSGFPPLTMIPDCCHTRCRGLLSVPLGRDVLPHPLSVIDMVGPSPTIYLMLTRPISLRKVSSRRPFPFPRLS